MTTSSAVVSFKQIFQAGMGYVAVSRVTSLSGLHIIDMDESKLNANPDITESLNNMQKSNLEHIMPFYHISQSLDRDSTFSVIHHNTQGLPSHIQDIQTHHELCLSDVLCFTLCFTETRLQGFVASSLHLDGYTMFERSRHVSYTNFSDMARKDGGGVAIYVKNHIVAHEIRYVHHVTDLEFVVVQIEAPFCALIVTVYRPPTYNVKPFLDNLTALLEYLEMVDIHPIIVCGDFQRESSLLWKKANHGSHKRQSVHSEKLVKVRDDKVKTCSSATLHPDGDLCNRPLKEYNNKSNNDSTRTCRSHYFKNFKVVHGET
ncbi:hypothetical protein WMY93_005461 [Mugilogobius chulae]|uniref:Endonuclease/exonuclease/phosphatase domain-containing protein n=1 Tax=Mugilogobius chulae TaxID=88201 RepID=A0AAW0PT95_9GOBI